jgi:hypothetical protein
MDFRRNGLRDERRRRVLIDESLNGGEGNSASNASAPADTGNAVRTPSRSYSDAAIASSQTPVSAFLPKRPYITWAVWFAGLALIGGIVLLHRFVFLGTSGAFRTDLQALDMTAQGGLASWFTAVMLAASAFASLLVFHIRRHRMDDYSGRYRWWLWLVPLLIATSICASTGLHNVLSGILTAVTGAELAARGKGWWLMAYTAIFVPIVPQLFIEMWRSRLATFHMVVALFELEVVQLATPLATTLCHSALLLAAHLGVLVTVLAYGRYVFLDAHGRLSAKRKTHRRSSAKSGTVTTESDAKEDPPRASKQLRVDAVHSRVGESTVPPTVTRPAEPIETSSSDSDRKLSKAERRRLRREAHGHPRD